MSTGFLHLHVTIVTLFLLFMLFKTALLLASKEELLNKVRAKTKVVDMVLGLLIVVTGFGLIVFKGDMQTYLYIKVIAVFAAIPLGIIGLKKGNKVLTILSVILLVYAYGVAETKSPKFKKDKFSVEQMATADALLDSSKTTLIANGQAIYAQLCTECHGEDGKKGLFKAADLTLSVMTREEKINIVTNGKGTMTKFDSQLSSEDIELVVSYIETLK